MSAAVSSKWGGASSAMSVSQAGSRARGGGKGGTAPV